MLRFQVGGELNAAANGVRSLPWADVKSIEQERPRALEIFKSEQDISRCDLNVFVLRARPQMPSKKIAARYNLTVENVDVIKHRNGKLLRKYGRDCYLRALRRDA